MFKKLILAAALAFSTLAPVTISTNASAAQLELNKWHCRQAQRLNQRDLRRFIRRNPGCDASRGGDRDSVSRTSSRNDNGGKSHFSKSSVKGDVKGPSSNPTDNADDLTFDPTPSPDPKDPATVGGTPTTNEPNNPTSVGCQKACFGN